METEPGREPPRKGAGGGMGRVAVRGTSVTLLGQGLRVGLQMASLVVLTRLLTPADFGLVAMAMAVVGVADILRDFGLNSAAIQAKTLSPAERSNLFWANLGLGAVATVLVIAAAPLIARYYHEPRLVAVVLAVSMTFVLNGAATQWRADLSRSLRFTALAVSEIGAQLVALICAIAAAVAGLGYWAIVVQLNVVAVVTLVTSGLLSGFVPMWPQRDVSIRRFVRYGGGMLGVQLIGYSTRKLDDVVVGKYLGAAELGLYNRAYQLLMVPLNQINAPLTRIALPILSRVREDHDVYQRYLHRGQLVACYVSAPLLAAIAGLAGPIVAVLFGAKWAGVAPILAVLAIGGVFRSVAQIAYWVFLAEGLTAQQFRLFLFTGPMIVILILCGLPWGTIGVAVGVSVGYIVDWLIQMWWISRISNAEVRPLMRTSLGALVGAGLPSGLAAYGITALGLPNLLALVLGGIAAVAAVLVAGVVLPWIRRDFQLLIALGRTGFARRRATA